jgi:hypothetical protein
VAEVPPEPVFPPIPELELEPVPVLDPVLVPDPVLAPDPELELLLPLLPLAIFWQDHKPFEVMEVYIAGITVPSDN